MTQFSKKEENEKIDEYVILNDAKSDSKKSWKDNLVVFLDGKYFIPIVVILVAMIAFSLGRISGIQERRPPVRVISDGALGEVKGVSVDNSSSKPTLLQEENGGGDDIDSSVNSGSVVGSKNGTKYHYPWCGGAKQISSKNLITFDSIEDARAAGYTPAANCKGLQ